MRIAGARLHPVALRLRTPLVTARESIGTRIGYVVSLHTLEGSVGWGEALPLPGFGGEELPACRSALDRWCRECPGADVEALAAFPVDTPAATPSAAGAIEQALLDLEGQRRGCRIADLLCRDGEPVEMLELNTLLFGDSPAAIHENAVVAVDSGFRALKLKVGAASRESDVERVAAARNAVGPDPRIRLDANGIWTRAQAAEFLAEVERYDIEYIEQPVAAADVDGLVWLRRNAKVRVAADEAISDERSATRLLDAEAADVFILKPASLGGMRNGAAIAERAARVGIDCVVTSSIGSSLGTAGALQLAAALPTPASGARRPSGLATAGLLEADLAIGLSVHNGCMRLPLHSGLGVKPDQRLLDVAATAPAFEFFA